jgi:hypothetical protein
MHRHVLMAATIVSASTLIVSGAWASKAKPKPKPEPEKYLQYNLENTYISGYSSRDSNITKSGTTRPVRMDPYKNYKFR